MTLRKQHPVTWPIVGLSDALDGSEEFRGACSLLTNLIPAQNNKGMVMARVAAAQIATLPDYSGGPVTCLLEAGNILYGMYASTSFAGQDRPFAYDLTANSFATIAGMTSGNLPASQATTGDWTPPAADKIGTRVLFSHPGFPGGSGNAPYYQQLFINTTNLSSTITIYGSTGITAFLQAGQRIFAAGIPAGTTIQSFSSSIINTTGTGTSGNNNFTVASAAGLVVGQSVFGPGISSGTIITGIAGTTITINTNLTANLSSTPITFVQQTVVLSAAATATANNVSASIVSASATRFGWLDVSNFSATVQGNTAGGNPFISGAPAIAGIQPGMTVTGPNIPANTTVFGAENVVINAVATSTSIGSGQLTLSNNSLNSAIAVGMTVAGAGIPSGSLVAAVAQTATTLVIQINQGATANASNVPVTISGAIIVLSQNATGANVGAQYTIAGGTPSNPLWGAGDTNIIPLPGVPVFVKQYAGSAAFGVNTTNPATAGVTFSDAGIPCQVTNASQALTFQNAIPITAAAGLPLDNQLGGIIQSLIVFQGGSNIQQITGTPALGNVALNTSQTATGTLAPNSVASTPKGLLFAAPDGLRLLDFDGRVSDPVGTKGAGIITPFISAVTPTRMAAAYNENVYRITVTWAPPVFLQPVFGASQRTDEFWLHLDTGRFTGPHTSTMDLIAPWQSQNSFVGGLHGGQGKLWRSDPYPLSGSSYTENGTPLTWTLRTVLLPDDASMTANSLVESSIWGRAALSTDQWTASAISDQGVTEATATMESVTQSQSPIYWGDPVVFRQMALQVTGNSQAETLIGPIRLRYQKLNYPLPFRPVNGM